MANGEVFEPVEVPSEAFVWGREGKRMRLNDRRKGDGAPFMQDDPDSGLDDSAELGATESDVEGVEDGEDGVRFDLMTFAQIENHFGARFGSVGIVGIGPKGGFKHVNKFGEIAERPRRSAAETRRLKDLRAKKSGNDGDSASM